jgi:hypothetical protein
MSSTAEDLIHLHPTRDLVAGAMIKARVRDRIIAFGRDNRT